MPVIRLEQPENGNKRTVILHWDGRLDNRDDLLLELREWLHGDTSNGALALAAYERWGTEGLVHLIGDWSAVIHDGANGGAILASDFAGVRPLFYHVRRGQVSDRAACCLWWKKRGFPAWTSIMSPPF